MKLSALALVAASALVVGCSTTVKEPTIVVPSTSVDTKSPVSNTQLAKVKERVDADPNLLKGCASLTPVPENANLDDLLVVHQRDAIVHGDCMRRAAAIAKLLKEAFNLE